jgi:DNA-binding FadR family transcriptional regulator
MRDSYRLIEALKTALRDIERYQQDNPNDDTTDELKQCIVQALAEGDPKKAANNSPRWN